MKNLTEITDNEDIVTKEYVDLSMVIDSEYDETTHTVTLVAGSLTDGDSVEY